MLSPQLSIIDKNDKVLVEIPVSNSSDRDGLEVVHWFVSDPVSSISRPLKELKYFDKKIIKAVETKVFQFEIDPIRDLSFVHGLGNCILQSGEYYISVGNKKIAVNHLDK